MRYDSLVNSKLSDEDIKSICKWVATNEVKNIIKEVKSNNLMCIKVDISKAYDSIYWSYILKVMECIRFPPCWIHWIQTCLEISSFQILINDELGQPFKSSSGLRQGNPLAPYLFLYV